MSVSDLHSNALSEFARLLSAEPLPSAGSAETPSAETSFSETPTTQTRVEIDPDGLKNGLAQLVLTLIKLIHELLERQAIRRIEANTLNDDEIERIGLALMKQAEQLEVLCEVFSLDDEDLNLDLGPLGRLL